MLSRLSFPVYLSFALYLVMRVVFRLVFCLLFVAPVIGMASNHAAHETVVVTAKKTSADDINTHSTSNHTTVIQSSDFANDLATVSEVLSSQSGIQIREIGGIGSYSSVSIRGSTSAQVSVYLDGMLLNDANGGVVDLSQILLSAIDRIEIYRGNTPAQLGTSAIGGAVNLVTKKASSTPSHLVKLGYGSFKTRLAALTSTFSSGNTNFLVNAEFLDSDNDYELLNTNQTENNPFDDRVERRRNAQYEQGAILLSANQKVSEDYDWSGIARYSTSSKGVPEFTNAPNNDARFDVEDWKIQGKLNQRISDELKASYQLYGGVKETEYDDRDDRIGLDENFEKARFDNVGLKSDLQIAVGAHLLNLAAKVRHETYKNEDFLNDTSIRAKRTTSSIVVQDEWLNSSGDLQLTSRSGARLQRDELSEPASSRNDEAYFDLYLGSLYNLTPQYGVGSSVSLDVRPPRLYELFGDTGSTLGNDELVEEHALNAEISFKAHNALVEFNSALFYRKLEDAIVQIYDSRGIGRAENIARAQVFGLEIDANKRLLPNWISTLKATLQDSEDRSDVRAFQGNSLPGVYETQVFFANTLTFFDIDFSLEYQHQSGGFYDRSASVEMPTSDQLHLSIERSWLQHQVSFAAKNLTDERFEDFNRFPGPGRRAFITYSYTFN